jgi:XXXCH domain-containing protein
MGEKAERTLNRLELADYLQDLSEQLRRGFFEAQGRQWTVPDAIEARLEFKEKHGRLQAKLAWSCGTLPDYGPTPRDQIAPGTDSLKTVKKRLGVSFKALQQAMSQGAFPEARTLEDFVASSRAFAALAEPDWKDAMQEYLNHLANLEQAVANRQQEVMLRELRELQNCMSSCHREFKSRGGAAK